MPTLLEKWTADAVAKGRTVFEVRTAEAVAKKETEMGRDYILSILREKFNRIPKDTEQAILAMNDPIALQSWAVRASMSQTLDEFLEAFNS